MNVRTPEIREKAEELGVSLRPLSNTAISEQERERIQSLMQAGASGSEIARAIGRSKTAVRRYVRELKTYADPGPADLTLGSLIVWSRRPGGRLAQVEAGL